MIKEVCYTHKYGPFNLFSEVRYIAIPIHCEIRMIKNKPWIEDRKNDLCLPVEMYWRAPKKLDDEDYMKEQWIDFQGYRILIAVPNNYDVNNYELKGGVKMYKNPNGDGYKSAHALISHYNTWENIDAQIEKIEKQRKESDLFDDEELI